MASIEMTYTQPWNWVKHLRVATNAPEAMAKYGPGGHADRITCATPEYLFLDTTKLERLCETDNRFAQNACEMQAESGKAYITYFKEHQRPAGTVGAEVLRTSNKNV